MTDEHTIETVADEIARRFDAVHKRTEDRLNDEYLQRVIREKATEVLSQMALPLRPVWDEKRLRRVKHDEKRHDAVVGQIAQMLTGRAPQAQAAILAELVAMWLAGHQPAIRDLELVRWLGLLRDLVPVKEKDMFGPGGFPFR